MTPQGMARDFFDSGKGNYFPASKQQFDDFPKEQVPSPEVPRGAPSFFDSGKGNYVSPVVMPFSFPAPFQVPTAFVRPIYAFFDQGKRPRTAALMPFDYPAPFQVPSPRVPTGWNAFFDVPRGPPINAAARMEFAGSGVLKPTTIHFVRAYIIG